MKFSGHIQNSILGSIVRVYNCKEFVTIPVYLQIMGNIKIGKLEILVARQTHNYAHTSEYFNSHYTKE